MTDRKLRAGLIVLLIVSLVAIGFYYVYSVRNTDTITDGTLVKNMEEWHELDEFV